MEYEHNKNLNYNIKGEAREGLSRLELTEGSRRGTYHYMNIFTKEFLNFCPPLAEASDFDNGFARGVSSITGKDILISHMRTVEGSKDYIDATEKLAKLISENPQELLPLQQPLVLIDGGAFSFLLDVVRYKFLEQSKAKILHDDPNSTLVHSAIDKQQWNHEINIKDYANTIKETFEKMQNSGMLSQKQLMNYSVRLNELPQSGSYIPTAVNFALNKYYIDLIDCKSLGEVYSELNKTEHDMTLANLLPSNSIITKKSIDTTLSNYEKLTLLAKELNSNRECLVGIRDQVSSIIKNCDDSSFYVSNKLHQNSTYDVDRAMQKLVVAKYAELKEKSEDILNKSTKGAPSLNAMVKDYKSAVSKNAEKINALENYMAAYIGLGDFGELEAYTQKQPNDD